MANTARIKTDHHDARTVTQEAPLWDAIAVAEVESQLTEDNPELQKAAQSGVRALRQARLRLLRENLNALTKGWNGKKTGPRNPDRYVENIWTSRLVLEWENLLERAKRQGELYLVKDVLTAMTAMTTLSMLPLKVTATQAQPVALPANLDLSKLSTDELKELLAEEERQESRGHRPG